MSRRTFLQTAGAVAGSALVLPHLIPSKVLAAQARPGANQRPNIALIGAGERGMTHLASLVDRMGKGELNVAAVCDADEKRLDKAKQIAGPKANALRDYRYILQRKDIDAVIIATPDHWHGVQFVQAAECGKHIYCESPACSTIDEGKAMIEAARKAKIATQIGAQGRSLPEAYLMRRYLAGGAIGRVRTVTCWSKPGLIDDNPMPDEDPPPELDWGLWLGPLRWQSYNPRFSNGVFRWMMESGGGRICHPGAHVMSCAMWWLGADGTGPDTIEAVGTVPTKGLWDTAVDMKVTYTFKNPDWVLTWNQRGKSVESEEKILEEQKPEERTPDEASIAQPDCGAIYHGEKGEAVAWGGDQGIWAERKVRQWKAPSSAVEIGKSPDHIEDWLNGIRTGAKTIMNVEAGVGVANLCILGNLSFILGRKLNWDNQKFEITGDEQARRLMSRPQRFPYYM
ncbi:MAG: Gfo/Idh/MocA family oxidoreductase [Thermoguttaceae bacterium]